MDVTCNSLHELNLKVNEFLADGWKLFTGIDESVITGDSGISTIIYTRTLVKY